MTLIWESISKKGIYYTIIMLNVLCTSQNIDFVNSLCFNINVNSYSAHIIYTIFINNNRLKDLHLYLRIVYYFVFKIFHINIKSISQMSSSNTEVIIQIEVEFSK